MGENSPLSKAEILRALPDDAETDARQEEKEQPLIPTRGRSSLAARDAASVPVPPGLAPALPSQRLPPPEPAASLAGTAGGSRRRRGFYFRTRGLFFCIDQFYFFGLVI